MAIDKYGVVKQEVKGRCCMLNTVFFILGEQQVEPGVKMKLFWSWFTAAILLSLLLSTSAADASVLVCSSPEGSGGSSSDCLTLNTLDKALQEITSDTTVYLEPGIHYLENFTLLEGFNNVRLMGQVEEVGDGVIIKCIADGVGLSFVNVTDLSIQNVVIESCGLSEQNLADTVALLKQFVDTFIDIPLGIQVGVFLGHCENVKMERVTITNTHGIGLIGINIIGNSLLKEIEFSLNIRQAPSCTFNDLLQYYTGSLYNTSVGGGAYFLYQDYVQEYRPNHRGQQYTLDIEQSMFVNNSDCSYVIIVEVSYRESERLRELGLTVGGGGGLATVFTQVDYGVDITTSSTTLLSNTARYGAGAHVAFYTGVTNTHVTFDNCTFLNNGFKRAEFINGSAFSAGGGALAVFNDLSRPDFLTFVPIQSRNVSVHAQDTVIYGNGATIGSGLLAYSLFTSVPPNPSEAVIISFTNCTFEANNGLLGSAMWVYELKLAARYQFGLQIKLEDITVIGNNASPLERQNIALRVQDNSATLDIRSTNLTIGGNSYLIFNTGTAIQCSGSAIGMLPNSTVVIEGNRGVYGGAINLFQLAYLVVSPGTELYFRDNAASLQGGVFYINLLGGNSVAFFDDCFLYFSYQNFVICDSCSDLNNTDVYIEFSGNTAPTGSIIYGSALTFCPWARPLRDEYQNESVVEILHNYFPTKFNFSEEPVGFQRVTTPSSRIVIDDIQPIYFAAPGEEFKLRVSAFDFYDQVISTPVGAYILDSLDLNLNRSERVQEIRAAVGDDGISVLLPDNPTDTPARVYSLENQIATIGLFTTDSQSTTQTFIIVEVGSCPQGFIINNLSLSCECDPRLIERDIECDVSSQTLIASDGLWVGPISSGGELAVADCVGYCEEGTRSISARADPVNYDVQCEDGWNRGGILCGRCQDGYSIVLGSFRCLKCHNGYVALFFFFLLLGILLVAMISYFQITITAGYLNGILFYSNIVSLYGHLLTPAAPFDGRLSLTSFLTLNLGIETCFHDGMNSLEKVWWQLSFPLYLVILMLITVGLARCCKWKRGAGFSTIQAFATLSLLCYVSVLNSCVELVSAVTIKSLSDKNHRRWIVDPSVTYFEGGHGVLAFSAIVLLILYIIPLPLFLLFPTVLYRAPYLRRYKPFYDVFWAPFKPKFRFWLGFRLIFRWVPFGLVYLAPDPLNTFTTGFLILLLMFAQLVFEPFDGKWRNLVDSLFLLNLVILFFGSVYYSAIAESDSGDKRDMAQSQATGFSTTFVIFAYMGFGAVLVYHMIIRFPKLKEALLNCRNRMKKKDQDVKTITVPQSPIAPEDLEPRTEGEEECISIHHTSDGRGTQVSGKDGTVTAVDFTLLREPLLETEGSIMIVTIPSSPNAPDSGEVETSITTVTKTTKDKNKRKKKK